MRMGPCSIWEGLFPLGGAGSGGREVVGRGSGRAVLCPDPPPPPPPPPPPTHTQAAYFVTLDVVALRLRAYQVAERVHNHICT